MPKYNWDLLTPALVFVLIFVVMPAFVFHYLGITSQPSTVDLLKPEAYAYHVSGGYIDSDENLSGYTSDDEAIYNNVDTRYDWSYDLVLTPIPLSKTKEQFCVPTLVLYGNPGCDSPVFAAAAKVEKDGHQYITWYWWQNRPDFDYESFLKDRGAEIITAQYFVAQQGNFKKDPGTIARINSIHDDTSTALNSWVRIAVERDRLSFYFPE